MNKRYMSWFEFVKTEQEAKNLVDLLNSRATPYMRKNHPAHYTPWTDSKTKIAQFVVWSYR